MVLRRQFSISVISSLSTDTFDKETQFDQSINNVEHLLFFQTVKMIAEAGFSRKKERVAEANRKAFRVIKF